MKLIGDEDMWNSEMIDGVYTDSEVQKEWIEFQKLTPEQMDKSNDRSIRNFLDCFPEHTDQLVEILDSCGVIGVKVKDRHNLIGVKGIVMSCCEILRVVDRALRRPVEIMKAVNNTKEL